MKRRLVERDDINYIREKMTSDSSQKIANHLGLSRSIVAAWKDKILIGEVSEELLIKMDLRGRREKRIEYVHANVAIKTRTEMARELGMCYSNLITLVTSLGYKNSNRDYPAKSKKAAVSRSDEFRILKMPSKAMWEMDNAGLIRWDIFATHPAYVDENGAVHKIVFVS